jgi:hypothetical protein
MWWCLGVGEERERMDKIEEKTNILGRMCGGGENGGGKTEVGNTNIICTQV